jgi:hypothetical protein
MKPRLSSIRWHSDIVRLGNVSPCNCGLDSTSWIGVRRLSVREGFDAPLESVPDVPYAVTDSPCRSSRRAMSRTASTNCLTWLPGTRSRKRVRCVPATNPSVARAAPSRTDSDSPPAASVASSERAVHRDCVKAPLEPGRRKIASALKYSVELEDQGLSLCRGVNSNAAREFGLRRPQ